MMLSINAIVWAILLWSSIFFDIAHAQDELLVCNIIDGQNKIHLELRKTEQLLANENLPVWSVNSRKRSHDQREGTVGNKLIPNFVKEEIGHFIFYHDKEKSAAVVLFMRSKTLFGIVDTRYHILDLPVGKCETGVEIGQHVEYISCTSMKPGIHLKPLDLSIRRHKDPVVEHDEPSEFVPANDDSMTNLYPEIMVFISHDVTKSLKEVSLDNYVYAGVIQYIVYFNAVDMLLSKFSTDHIKIHLNLAGIMIEEDKNTFEFFDPPNHENPRLVDISNTFQRFLRHAQRNLRTFSPESFDFFFISTSYNLIDSELEKKVEGMSYLLEVYDERRNAPFTPMWTGAIVHSMCGYEYITASHEVAHLMGVLHDPLNKGYCVESGQCYAVMQEIGKFCPDCLKWSDESVNDLKKYSKQNQDRCYLLNLPRSLHPHGTLKRTLSPSEQCRCYGFEPPAPTEVAKHLDRIPQDGCRRRLSCGRDAEGVTLPFPMDGTPCADNGLCWDRVCRRIPNAISM